MNTVAAQNTEVGQNPVIPMSEISKGFYRMHNEDAQGLAKEAVNRVMEICKSNNVQPNFSFNPNEAVPADKGIAVMPINITDKAAKKRRTIGVNIVLIPTAEAVLNDEQGRQFAMKKIQDSFLTYFSNQARPKIMDDGRIVPSNNTLPVELVDYITAGRREGGLKYFNDHADKYLDALYEKGFNKTFNKRMFRDCLQSASYAEQLLPTIPQTAWEGILKIMIQEADANPEYDAGLVRDWLETRNESAISLVDENSEIDLDAIATMASTA